MIVAARLLAHNGKMGISGLIMAFLAVRTDAGSMHCEVCQTLGAVVDFSRSLHGRRVRPSMYRHDN